MKPEDIEALLRRKNRDMVRWDEIEQLGALAIELQARLSEAERNLSETRAQLQHAWSERGFDNVIRECATLRALEEAGIALISAKWGTESWNAAWWAFREALSAQPEQGSAVERDAGLVSVPREPTDEMLRAGHGTMFVDVRYSRAADIVKRGYKAMIHAALTPEGTAAHKDGG